MIVLVNLANMCILLSANARCHEPASDSGAGRRTAFVFIILEMLRGKPVDPEKKAWSIWRAWRR